MESRRSYLDSVNEGRQRKPSASLEHLSRSLEQLEQQLSLRQQMFSPTEHAAFFADEELSFLRVVLKGFFRTRSDDVFHRLPVVNVRLSANLGEPHSADRFHEMLETSAAFDAGELLLVADSDNAPAAVDYGFCEQGKIPCPEHARLINHKHRAGVDFELRQRPGVFWGDCYLRGRSGGGANHHHSGYR